MKGGQERAGEKVGEYFPVDTDGSLGVGLVGKGVAGRGNPELYMTTEILSCLSFRA